MDCLVDLLVGSCLALPLPRLQTELGGAGLRQALKQTSSGVRLAYRFSPPALGLGPVLDATRLVEGVMCLSGADTCDHRI